MRDIWEKRDHRFWLGCGIIVIGATIMMFILLFSKTI